MKKHILTIVLLLWLTTILTMFFVVQKPDFLSISAGLGNLFLIVFIPCVMAILAACMGSYFLPEDDTIESLILGTAIGMGIWGLSGFGLAITGMAKPITFLVISLALTGYFAFSGKLAQIWKSIRYMAENFHASAKILHRWIPISLFIAMGLSFLMGLAPPIDDFDALSYHLAVPDRWLRDSGLIPNQVPTYWYPHIVEGSFIPPMVFGVDTSTHLIHLLWLVLTILLLWHWSRQIWNDTIAWDAIAILLTMPSLLWLAAWAYTDYALTFTGIATLYSIWKWRETGDKRWVSIGGVMAGLAMGTKYQSFFVPIIGAILILIWGKDNSIWKKNIFKFSVISICIALPWYLRNWILMNNPFYPFLFGGRYWDPFLTQIFSGAGTGIGLDVVELFLLPLTATLGHKDMSYFDGRFGPFFLLLFPITIWHLIQNKQGNDQQKRMLLAIHALSLTIIAVWVFGVINSEHLLVSRFLFPALIPATIPLAVGLNSLYKADASVIRLNFIFRAMIFFVVSINLINFSLHTINRNTVAVTLGIIPRQQYLESRLPGFASALQLLETIPSNSRVYLLFEPRSYGMKTYVEPDIINSHFPYDAWVYKTPEKIVAAWKQQGYTHILISRRGFTFSINNKNSALLGGETLLQQTENLLEYLGESRSQEYVLYRIP